MPRYLIAITTVIGLQKLEEQAALLEYENYQLTKQIAEAGSVESIKRIATLELGLVDPDSEFYGPGN